MSSKDNDEERNSKSNNVEMAVNIKKMKSQKSIFNLHLSRYQIELEGSIQSNDFIFDCFHLLYYKCHKITFRRGRSYKDCLIWIKNKEAAIISSAKKIINGFNTLQQL